MQVETPEWNYVPPDPGALGEGGEENGVWKAVQTTQLVVSWAAWKGDAGRLQRVQECWAGIP